MKEDRFQIAELTIAWVSFLRSRGFPLMLTDKGVEHIDDLLLPTAKMAAKSIRIA